VKKAFVAVIMYLFLTVSNADVILINNKVLNQSKLYRYEVQSIFTLRTTYWNNGIPITPVFISFDDPIHSIFVSQVLMLSTYHFNNLIGSKIQQGDAKHYIVVHSIEEAIDSVTKISGAIAYVPCAMRGLFTNDVRAIDVVD
jgi:hypothetical protein